MLAAAQKGADAVKEREWTEEEREARRQFNAEKGLAQYLPTGYHGPLWAPEDVALLGNLPDDYEFPLFDGRHAIDPKRPGFFGPLRASVTSPAACGTGGLGEVLLVGVIARGQVALYISRYRE
jgi:hypothetical protein